MHGNSVIVTGTEEMLRIGCVRCPVHGNSVIVTGTEEMLRIGCVRCPVHGNSVIVTGTEDMLRMEIMLMDMLFLRYDESRDAV